MSTHATGHLVTAAEFNAKKDQEIWVPVTGYASGGGVTATALSWQQSYPLAVLAASVDGARMSFRCPSDFVSIVEAKIIILPRVTDAAANLDIYSTYAAIGQNYQTHEANNTAATYNIATDVFFGVDVSAILASLAANDIVGVRLSLGDANDDVDVIGFYMKYA